MTRRDLLTLLAAFLFGLLLLALCPRAPAACGRVRACPTESSAVIATPIVPSVSTATVPIIAVQVPTYSASYQPAAALAPELQLLLQQLSAQAIAHEQRLSRLEGGAARPAPAMPPVAPESAATTQPRLFASCAQCHTTGKLNPKTTFALFGADGRELTLDCQHVARVLVKVGRGEMPPSGPATSEADLAELEDHYAGK